MEREGTRMRKTIVGAALALAALAAWALPTLEQVENEVRLGHLTSAESMMNEVVTARPGSARAHYVYAEVLARNGKFADAREQARLAREADPRITFTDAGRFTAFEQLLERAQRVPSARAGATPAVPALPATATASTSSGGIPGWIWLALLAAAGIMLWRGFSRSRAGAAGAGLAGTGAHAMTSGAPAYGLAGSAGPGSYGPGSPYGAPPARSGMLGTGLAAAGGFAAGMLADELMHRHRESAGALDNLGPAALGGEPSDAAATELESRPIDFGTGAGWGGDAGSIDAGSFDTGGGSDWS
jgi:hypothetical protein